MRKTVLIPVFSLLLTGFSTTGFAATVFSENFEGYTQFPDQIPLFDPGNKGIPKISEGASEKWYAARFEDPTSKTDPIDSDLYVQRFGGGSNLTHTGRFEDDAGLLFKLDTTNLTGLTLSFDWRTFLASTNDRFVAGYRIGAINDFGTCTGNGEPGCYADLRTSLPWYTTQTSTTPTGNWTQLLRASASNSWNSQSYTLPTAVEGQSQVWFAFWLDNGEGDYGKLDNVKVTATVGLPPAAVPVPAAVWLLSSGLMGLAAVARRRKSGSR